MEKNKEKLQVLEFSQTRTERKATEAFGISQSRVNSIKERHLERVKNTNDKLYGRKETNQLSLKSLSSRI
jgi:hypothetical protein